MLRASIYTSISVGQSRPLDSNSDSITGSSQFKEPINVTNTIPKKETQPERKIHLKIGTWNLRRGLSRREHEIVNLIESEGVDVLFLTETDTGKINASNYKMSGYKTFTQSCESEDDTVRVIAIVKENCGAKIQLRPDLMSNTFPSIWLEVEDSGQSMASSQYPPKLSK